MQAQSGAESELPFTCTVMLLGISGCGKSSVINSLLGRQACATDAFGASTKKVPTFAPSSLCSLSVLKPLLDYQTCATDAFGASTKQVLKLSGPAGGLS